MDFMTTFGGVMAANLFTLMFVYGIWRTRNKFDGDYVPWSHLACLIMPVLLMLAAIYASCDWPQS